MSDSEDEYPDDNRKLELEYKQGNNQNNQGNLLKDIDNKTVRRQGLKPIKRVFVFVLFSVTKWLGIAFFISIFFFQKKVVNCL